MTDVSEATIPPAVAGIISGISDSRLARAVYGTVTHAMSALAELKRFNLPQDSFEEIHTENSSVDKHIEIAPYAFQAVAAINRLIAHLGASFVPPAQAEEQSDDFDLAFDLVDGPTGDSAGLAPAREAHEAMTIDEQVADAAHAFGGMLRTNVLRFADRLEAAVKQNDGWPLLAELDDSKRKLVKAVQGLLFGVLAVFKADARRDEILPEYRSSITEAVSLRSVLADLTLAVTRFNNAIAAASAEQVVPLLVAVSDRLQRFAARPEYRTLRGDDKKAVIDFRSTLYRLRGNKGGVPMVPLKQAVEGFSKFLEAMGAINHREVLVLHDRQRLEIARDNLVQAKSLVADDPEGARAHLDQAVEGVATVHGRNQELDDARRLHRIDPPPPEDLGERVEEWLGLVQSTLQRVG
ncbi:MAG: hypothetical protein H7Z43_04720 [Clostridia bacterium]|nr:hypothetical protein [Deltaproteobacteria bacterium]